MFFKHKPKAKLCHHCNQWVEKINPKHLCIDCATTLKKQNAKNKAKSPVKRKISSVKLDMIQLLGGKCSHCGYSRYMSALEFHHKDPETKLYLVSGLISRYTITPTDKVYTLLINEVNKCLLLCSNCHAAKHAGEW